MDLYDEKTRFICLVTGLITFCVGMSCNSLIIWTFIRIKRLRIVQNVFIVLLAVVDLLIIGYILPFALAVLIWNRPFMSMPTCIFNAAFGNLLFTSCLQFITCIAVNRYVRICRSETFDRIYTKRNVCIIVVFCLLYWSVFAVPLVSLKKPFVFERDVHVCIFNRFESKLYTNIYIIFCLIIPITITALSYGKIFLYVRRAKLKLYKKWNNGLARQRIIHELTVTWCQFVIFIAYLILYVPFAASTMVGVISDINITWLSTCGMYLAFLNSSFNGILYGVMNSNIRKAYFEVLPCFKKQRHNRIHQCILQNSATQTSRV